MIKDIIVGLSQAIDKEFNTDLDIEYEIHAESIPQKLSGRSFIITVVNNTHTRTMKERFSDSTIISVQYFPESKDRPKSECYKVQERLERALEMITVDGNTVIGRNIESRVSDDVLVTNVTYNIRTYRFVDTDAMEILELEGYVNE